MHVRHCRVDFVVPEQGGHFLYRHTPVNKIGGKSSSEAVRMDILNARFRGYAFEREPRPARRQSRRAFTYEKRRGVICTTLQISPQKHDRDIVQIDDAFFASLAEHCATFLLEIDVLDIDAAYFADAAPRGGEKRDERLVSIGFAALHQSLNIRGRKRVADFLRRLYRAQVPGGVARYQSLAVQPSEE